MKPIKIAIVDDHRMVSKAIEEMLSKKKLFSVVCNCANGELFMNQLEVLKNLPDVVLMDVNMPLKDGFETTIELKQKYPDIKVLALSVDNNEETIIKMIKAGAGGYLLKDMSPSVLFKAIEEIYSSGKFYPDFLYQSLVKIETNEKNVKNSISSLKEKELEFIKLSCTELTYKEIADRMAMSPKTIDGYRDSVFIKLGVKSRIGIVIFALKNNLD